MAADLEGHVCLWRLPGGLPFPSEDTAARGHASATSPSPVRVGSYCHTDWVRCLAEVEGVIVSCCKAGEIRCATSVAPEQGSGELVQERESPRRALRRGDSELGGTLVVQSSWLIGGTGEPHRDLGPGDLCGEGSSTAIPMAHQQQQVFGVAVDQSGIVVGCQDKSIRQFMFTTRGGLLTYA